MGIELFIARRLKLSNESKSASPSLNVATVGIVLAILIMILSVVIVMGFKREVTHKLYSIDSHLKVYNGALGIDESYSTVNSDQIFKGIASDKDLMQSISSMSLMAEKPAILKTENDFKGLVYRGVDSNFDWSYIKDNLISGRVPLVNDTSDEREIVISKVLSNQLQLKVGDKIFTYFIDNKVKARRSIIVGIFNTDFDTFDKGYILGNIKLLQSVNGWNGFTGNYVGINMKNTDEIPSASYSAYKDLVRSMIDHNNTTLYCVSNLMRTDQNYFTWLSMLDMNVVIILILMIIVSSFTLISALLMIVLERIKLVGMLKSLGATNGMIRRIFIYLTTKLIIKSIIIGNVIGIGLSLLQQHFHIIHLNPEAYYMSYVPIEISPTALLVLNVAIIVISYLTLIAPSHIIATIKPTSTMKFE